MHQQQRKGVLWCMLYFNCFISSRFGPAEAKGGMSHAEIEAVLQSTIKDIEEKRSKTKSFLPKVYSCTV